MRPHGADFGGGSSGVRGKRPGRSSCSCSRIPPSEAFCETKLKTNENKFNNQEQIRVAKQITGPGQFASR